MGKMVKETIHAKGIDIGIYTTNFENEFISLTDIAKYRNEDDPRFVIQNWMRNRNTIEFLGVWEELHNPEFNRVQFEAVKNEAGLNRFVMTPTKWITQMNAIGIVSKAGRYGGTYAHSDIAMSFATWISPEFQLYIMKDYRRLKTDENSRLSLNWNLNREISKLNYKIHTDAIKENLIPPELTVAQVAYTYANEADMINVVLCLVAQWRKFEPCLSLVIFKFAVSTSIGVHPVHLNPSPCKLKNHKLRTLFSDCDRGKIARRLNEAMRWHRRLKATTLFCL